MLFINYIYKIINSCEFIKIFLQHPIAFYGAYPKPLQPLYLHILSYTSTYPVTGYDNRRIVFHNLLNDKSGFGILSTKSLPKVEAFTNISQN